MTGMGPRCSGVIVVSIFLGLLLAASSPSNGAAAGSQSGATLVVAEGYEPQNLNPDAKVNDPAYAIAQNVFNKLVTIDYSYKVIPDLSSGWDIAADGLTYTFHLVHGVKWSDGQPFSSADVVWTLNESITHKGLMASALSGVTSVTGPDPNTVVIKLKKPDAPLLGWLSWYGTFILPKHIYDGTDWLTNAANQKPVGTGPFVFSDWQKGSYLTVVANPNYFRGGPKVAKVVFRFIPDANTAVQALLNGEVDVDQTPVPPSQVAGLEKNPKVTVKLIPGPSRYYIGFNLRRAPMNNILFRQAVAYGINRQEVAAKATDGLSKPAEGMYTPVYAWAYNSQAQLPGYDPQKAEQLLDQAGIKATAGGTRVHLSLLYFPGTPYSDIATIVKDDLAKIGIDIDLTSLDLASYSVHVRSVFDWDLTQTDGFQGPDPDGFCQRICAGALGNVMGFSDPRIDNALHRASQLATESERGPLYKQAEAYALQDLPIVPLAEVASPLISASYVRGLAWTDALGKVTFSDFSLATVAPH